MDFLPQPSAVLTNRLKLHVDNKGSNFLCLMLSEYFGFTEIHAKTMVKYDFLCLVE